MSILTTLMGLLKSGTYPFFPVIYIISTPQKLHDVIVDFGLWACQKLVALSPKLEIAIVYNLPARSFFINKQATRNYLTHFFPHSKFLNFRVPLNLFFTRIVTIFSRWKSLLVGSHLAMGPFFSIEIHLHFGDHVFITLF